MARFAKFDPWAFLEMEKQATAGASLAKAMKDDPHPTDKPGTLASLATLAGPPSQNGNRRVGDFDTTAVHHGDGQNQKRAPTPANVAKVAKLATQIAVSKDAMWSDVEDERAAMIEYDGGAPRAWAEAVARLDPAYPPCDIPPKRWLQFIDDCGRFLDDGWATTAERLGWGPLDLFGCDRTKPSARIDRAGLLWLLNGRKLLVLSADAAAIATASGGYLTFRPRISDLGGVVAWELPLNAR